MSKLQSVGKPAGILLGWVFTTTSPAVGAGDRDGQCRLFLSGTNPLNINLKLTHLGDAAIPGDC